MSKDYMVINNEFFEIIKPRKYKPVPSNAYPRKIHECYKAPSVYKVGIFNDWMKWADTIKQGMIINFGISSYNSQTFTLTGNYYENGEFIGKIKITKAHNRIYIV